MNNLNPLIGFGGEPFIVAGGVLQVGDGASAPLFLPPNVVNNATIEFVGPAAPSIDIPTSLTGTGNVVVSSGRVTYGGLPLTYAGSTTVLGSGTVMTAAVNNNAALFVGAGARMEAFASTFGSLAGSGELLFLGNITVGGDNTNTTFSGTFIGNSNSFTKTGSGTLTLTNPNAAVAFAGSTFAVDGGVLRIGNGIMGPTFLPSNIVDNATIEFAGSFDPVTVAAGLTGTGNVLVSGGQVDVPGPPLAHAGSTTVTGTSILTGRVANNGALVIDAGARVDAVDSTVGSLTGAGLLNVLGAGIGVGGDGTSTTFSGVVAAGANLYKTGAGTLTLSGVNTNVGVMTINGGTLLLTGSSPGAVAVNAGADLRRYRYGERKRDGECGRHARPRPQPRHHQHGQPHRGGCACRGDPGYHDRHPVRQHERDRHGDDRRRHPGTHRRLRAAHGRRVHDCLQRRGRRRHRNLRRDCPRARPSSSTARRCESRTWAAPATTSPLPRYRRRQWCGAARAATTTGARRATGSAALPR